MNVYCQSLHCLLLASLVLLTTALTPARAGEIILRLSDPPERGNVIALVFRDGDSFGSFRDAWRREVFSVDETEPPYRIQDLPEGDYAVLLFRDENNNGRLDRNFIGIPSEPFALSNDYQPSGPPSFQRARVRVTPGEPVEQSLSLYRPLGGFGQVGVGPGVIGQTSPYRDSSDSPLQLIPAITYLGERLQWTGPQLRYLLATGDNWRLAAQADLRLGAYEESDSPWLEGLGDRKTSVMGGLALTYELPAGLSLSGSAQTDLLGLSKGSTARLQLSRGFQLGLLRVSPSLGLNWLDGSLADYEFGVDQAHARADRPGYSLSSALNWEAGFSVFYELSSNWQLVGNFGIETLDSAIVDSPIVDRQRLGRGFLTLSYIF
ncbi:MAG: MipA/OmpV family protein [Pseudohongiellaceae bacterium]